MSLLLIVVPKYLYVSVHGNSLLLRIIDNRWRSHSITGAQSFKKATTATMVWGTQLFEGAHSKISQAKQPPKLTIMAKK